VLFFSSSSTGSLPFFIYISIKTACNKTKNDAVWHPINDYFLRIAHRNSSNDYFTIERVKENEYKISNEVKV
jgi:hypothetical protein